MRVCRRAVLAVCDVEEAYARKFMEYLNQRKGIPFEIHAFTSAETLCAFAAERQIDILLVSERAMTEKVRQLSVGKRMMLSEGLSEIPGEISDLEETKEEDDCAKVFKYQPASQIIREVMDCYAAEQSALNPAARGKKEFRLSGVYSPSGCSWKILFDLALGGYLARSERVLYLNLDPLSGLEEAAESMGVQIPGRTVSDLVYFSRRKNGHLFYFLEGMVQTFGNLDYVLPAPFPEDLRDIGAEEWKTLFCSIRDHTDYSVLLADFGDCLESLPDLLKECSEIYLPVGSDRESGFRLAHFQKLLKRTGMREDEPWMHVIDPPSPEEVQEDLVFTVTQGAFYRLVREMEHERESSGKTILVF